jgi:peroxiredoxin
LAENSAAIAQVLSLLPESNTTISSAQVKDFKQSGNFWASFFTINTADTLGIAANL